MKKKVIIVVVIIVLMILLVPIPFKLRDGGTVEWKSLTYSIANLYNSFIILWGGRPKVASIFFKHFAKSHAFRLLLGFGGDSLFLQNYLIRIILKEWPNIIEKNRQI